MSEKLEKLLAKKQELEQRLEKIKEDMRKGLSADLEEQATELENSDVMVEIARVTEEELDAIKKVLDDIT